MSLHDLYQEIIIDHGKSPRNFGELPNCTHQHEGHNPLCGDRLVMYVILQNNKLVDLNFKGSGCAISIASASLLTEAIKGKTIAEFLQLFTKFHALVTEGREEDASLGKLLALKGVAQFPIRVKCASLAWHTLKAALLNEGVQPVSTEEA